VPGARGVRDARTDGTTQTIVVDGRRCRFDLARESERLVRATPAQRSRFGLSPAGYGTCWPDVDEDLSIDGMLDILEEWQCPAPLAEVLFRIEAIAD
jgi:hypothetical protein